MKKLLVSVLVICAFLAVSVYAGGIGAVKIPFDPDVGWAIINTTASGKLNVTAHVHNGIPDEEYTVSVRVRYEDETTDIYADIATLTTNGQGKGNVHVQVGIFPPDGSETLRRVAVRVRRIPNPLYVAIAWDVPLK